MFIAEAHWHNTSGAKEGMRKVRERSAEMLETAETGGRSVCRYRFISDRREFELHENSHARTALQNECGLERKSDGDAKLGMAAGK